MTLSNKKVKYIQRFAAKKPASQIARELRIPVEQVLSVTGKKAKADVEIEWNGLESLSNLILPVLIIVAPLLFYEPFWDYTNMPKAVFIQIGALLWLTIWLFQAFRKSRLEILKCPLYFPLAGLIGWAFLSLFWAKEPFGGFTIWSHWCACAVIFFLAFQTMGKPGQMNRVFASVAISGALVAFIGCSQYLFDVQWVKQTASPASTFANKNMGAQMMIAALPAGMAVFLFARRTAMVWMGALSVSIMATYLFYTFTRAAWLSVAAEIILAVILLSIGILITKIRPSLSGRKILPGSIALLLIILATNFTPEGIKWRWGEAARALTGVRTALQSEEATAESRQSARYGTSGRERLALWGNILEMVKEHPVRGVGLYNFIVYYPLAASKGGSQRGLTMVRRPAEAHNDYLQVTAEMGIPFLIFLFWSVGLTAKRVWELLRNPGPSKDRAAGIAFLAGITGLGVDALFSFPFYRAMPPFFLAVYSAGLFSLNPTNGGEKRPCQSFSKPGIALAGMATSLILLLIWTSVQYRWMKADRFFRSQRHAMNRKEDWQVVINLGEQVRKYNPLRKDTWHLMGRAYAITGRPEEALVHLEAYDRYYPHNGFNLFYLAQAYGDLEEMDKAENVLEHATEILPQDGFLQGGLGQVYQIEGRQEEALTQYRLAAELLPNNSFYYSLQGIMAAALGQIKEAETAYTKALSADGNSVRAHKGLGELLIQIPNRQEEGINYLEKALELEPEMEDASTIRKLVSETIKANSN